MRTKNAKKPARSIRYLLYADQKLRRISLRRISQRLKRAKRPSRSLRSKTAAQANTAPSDSAMRSPWAMAVVGAVSVVTAVALIAAREPAAESGVMLDDVSMESVAPTANEVPRRRPEPKKALPKPARPVEAAAVSAETAKPASPAASPAPAAAAAVTMTGCLELDDEAFWLKDASGADMPASRSWKSGFLKKRAPRIQLVDAAQTLKLRGHVGERVAATGILVNREMQARSLRRVAASCN